MKYGLAMLLVALPVFAAVNGVAVNGTTGKPQADVAINLVQPGQNGMQQLGQVKSGADGSFNIDANIPPGPALLQSTYQGVTYTQALPPGSPTTGVRVNVFQSTATPPEGMKTQHLILLEPSATNLRVSETFLTNNTSNMTFQDAVNGSIRLYLPEGAPTDLKVSIDSTGVPIQRPLEKGKQPGQYKVSYALKPGDTRFDLEYTIPATATFALKVFSNDPPVKLVTAGSVTLSGDGISDLGQEPSTQARVYGFKGNSFKVGILGVGSIRTPQDQPTAAPGEESGAPKCCEEVPARVNKQAAWVLGIALTILLLGGMLLFRRGTA
ncbi:MAG: hypothetical protein ABIR70_08695 [Bryobacteraceae bacterium]